MFSGDARMNRMIRWCDVWWRSDTPGSAFQVLATATGKARLPIVDSLKEQQDGSVNVSSYIYIAPF